MTDFNPPPDDTNADTFSYTPEELQQLFAGGMGKDKLAAIQEQLKQARSLRNNMALNPADATVSAGGRVIVPNFLGAFRTGLDGYRNKQDINSAQDRMQSTLNDMARARQLGTMGTQGPLRPYMQPNKPTVPGPDIPGQAPMPPPDGPPSPPPGGPPQPQPQLAPPPGPGPGVNAQPPPGQPPIMALIAALKGKGKKKTGLPEVDAQPSNPYMPQQ